MKKYQLIGRKKTFTKHKIPEYGQYHLHSLPYEILVKIFRYVNDLSQFARLSRVCLKFNSIVNKNFLYKSIKFATTDQFLNFINAHIPQRLGSVLGSVDTSTKVNYIQVLEIKNPPYKSSKNHVTNIAGSYQLSDSNKQEELFNGFIRGLKALISNDYNLKQLVISEISPQFEFDSLVVSTNILRKLKNSKRTLGKLTLKAQTGWSILFKINHLSSIMEFFNEIDELELNNFIIDETKLINTELPKSITINKITFVSCSYVNRPNKRTSCALFEATSALSLIQIKHASDLSLIDFIKFNNKLTYLSIDMMSKIFYTLNGNDVSIDPSFNYKSYNPFFKLICSQSGGYLHLQHLILDNFDLLHEFNHQSSLPGNNLIELLQYVSLVPRTTINIKQCIQTCTKCGCLKQETMKRDWNSLLKPFLSNRANIKMIDQNTICLESN